MSENGQGLSAEQIQVCKATLDFWQGHRGNLPINMYGQAVANYCHDVPALLTEVDRLTARLAALEGERDVWREAFECEQKVLRQTVHHTRHGGDKGVQMNQCFACQAVGWSELKEQS